MLHCFAPRFASIQEILDSVEFLENREVILAKGVDSLTPKSASFSNFLQL